MRAHPLDGGVDINLVPRAGCMNVGPFRELEGEAVAPPGAFYFVYLAYPDGATQRPSFFEQGLIRAGNQPRVEVRNFTNG